MPDRGLGSWPDRLARRNPAGVALVHGESHTTYAELAQRTLALSRGLRDRGIGRGDRVAFLGGNCPAFLDTLFACGRLGAVFVPLNTRLAAPELTYQLADAGATVLLHDAERSELASAAAPPGTVLVDAAGPAWTDLLGLPDPLPPHTPGGGRAGHAGARGPAGAPGTAGTARVPGTAGVADTSDPDVGLDQPALIMYTSGTTGVAKGVVLTHGNLTWNVMNVLVDVDLHADETALIVSPLFHAAALCMNSLPVLLKGGTLVLSPTARPDDMLRLIAAHRVTHLQGVPTIYRALADSPDWAAADLSSVRRASSGGSAAPESLIRTYLDRGIAFAQGYGMTESAPGVCFLPPQSIAEKIGAVGVPMFFTDVRVVDDAGADVPTGVAGEVLVRGPQLSPGYWHRPEATAAATTADGWYRSGDLATVDPDGHLRIVDRKKDMYISGGENVYPAEVEMALDGHPGIAESAVIAVPDQRWGEVGRALVVPAEGSSVEPADVLAFLSGRLARYKIPKSVLVVDQLPHTGYGKVRKAELRASFGVVSPASPVSARSPEGEPVSEHRARRGASTDERLREE